MLIVDDDILKISFRFPGTLGIFNLTMMPFWLKNTGETYQSLMYLIFHEIIGDFIQDYIDDVVVKYK